MSAESLMYVAADGSYGMAAGLTIVDTTHWKDADWLRLDEASDGDRADLAADIAGRYTRLLVGGQTTVMLITDQRGPASPDPVLDADTDELERLLFAGGGDAAVATFRRLTGR